MARKNPWVAAILNFIFPGSGFMYCETTPLLVGGFTLLMLSLAETAIVFFRPLTALDLLLSLGGGFAWAILGYGAAECINKSVLLPPPPPSPPSLEVPPTKPVLHLPENVFCTYCGAKNPSDASFCQKCGKKITRST